MNGKGRTMLRYGGAILVILALVMSLATVSHAKPHGGQHGGQHDRSKKVKVPEPGTGALLLLGSGLTGLAGYCWRRRTRGA